MSGFGGAKRDRTADLLHAMQALSQLSYGPDVAENEMITGLHFYRKRFVEDFIAPQEACMSTRLIGGIS